MRGAAVAIAVLLTGCGDVTTPGEAADAADVADANSRTALAQIEALRQEVRDLELEVEQLRQADTRQGAVNDEIYGNVGRLFDRTNRIASDYNRHTH